MLLQRAFFSLLLLFCGFTASLADNITIDETTFPDATFRAYVQNTLVKASSFDSGDVSSYTKITLNDANVTNVKGIEYFTALTTLDLSDCSIKEIDLSKNTALTYINVDNNQLTELDLPASKSLVSLYADNNDLTSLDVSNNTLLTQLYLSNNKISKLDLSGLSKLNQFIADSCGLSELVMPKKNKVINYIVLTNNKLKSIDLSGLLGPEELYLGYNQLTELDLTTNIYTAEVHCEHNRIETLKWPTNGGRLGIIDCSYNSLRSIDISGLKDLRIYGLNNNKLTSINLSSSSVVYTNVHDVTTSIASQSDTLGLSIDGTQVSLSVPEGFNKSLASDLKLTFDGEATDWSENLTAGTAADGMLPLLFPESFYSSARKRFFNYDSNTSTASPVTFTYNYDTQSTFTPTEKIDVSTMDVTIKVASYLMPVGVAESDDASRYASVCLPYAFTVPTGATAYGITAVSNGEAELETVATEGETVAANEPVILMTGSDTKAVALNISSAKGSKLSGNLLRSSGSEGVTFSTGDAANYWVLGLSSDTQEPGFWHPSTKYATNGNITIGPWRVYIDASSLSSTEASAKGFSLSNTGDDTTGINGVETSAKASADNHWYTLSGTRLTKAPTQKGVYIHRGRKVVVR